MANIILISPSKTMKESKSSRESSLVFPKKKTLLLKKLKTMSKDTLRDKLKISEKLTDEVYAYYQSFKEEHSAIKAYQGAQFKAMNVGELSEEALAFLDDHLFIMSGLYGLVKPNNLIGLYRLPMGIDLDGETLHHTWREPLKKQLKEHTVINLASKEYALALDASIDIIEVKFEKAPSHTVKTLRGLMVRYLAFKQSTHIDVIKTFIAQDYRYNKDESTEKIIVFTK